MLDIGLHERSPPAWSDAPATVGALRVQRSHLPPLLRTEAVRRFSIGLSTTMQTISGKVPATGM